MYPGAAGPGLSWGAVTAGEHRLPEVGGQPTSRGSRRGGVRAGRAACPLRSPEQGSVNPAPPTPRRVAVGPRQPSGGEGAAGAASTAGKSEMQPPPSLPGSPLQGGSSGLGPAQPPARLEGRPAAGRCLRSLPRVALVALGQGCLLPFGQTLGWKRGRTPSPEEPRPPSFFPPLAVLLVGVLSLCPLAHPCPQSSGGHGAGGDQLGWSGRRPPHLPRLLFCRAGLCRFSGPGLGWERSWGDTTQRAQVPSSRGLGEVIRPATNPAGPGLCPTTRSRKLRAGGGQAKLRLCAPPPHPAEPPGKPAAERPRFLEVR